MPLLAVFSFVVSALGIGPRVGRMDPSAVPLVPLAGIWALEAAGLVAIFLLAEGRCGARWLDGIVAGSIAWIFRGPLVVVTVVVGAGVPRLPWWHLALAWWFLYVLCGVILGQLFPTPKAPPDTQPALPE